MPIKPIVFSGSTTITGQISSSSLEIVNKEGASNGFDGGPFFLQGRWDSPSSNHSISYPTFCRGENSSGELSIHISNKSTSNPKNAYVRCSFIKAFSSNIDTTDWYTYKKPSTMNLSVSNTGNNITIVTDSDCSVTWTSIGAF